MTIAEIKREPKARGAFDPRIRDGVSSPPALVVHRMLGGGRGAALTLGTRHTDATPTPLRRASPPQTTRLSRALDCKWRTRAAVGGGVPQCISASSR